MSRSTPHQKEAYSRWYSYLSGAGGSHLGYRTLAHHLASHGFIVGMPEHSYNNRNNNSLEDTVENLTRRPWNIRTALDWFFTSRKFAGFLKPDAVSIIGYSFGDRQHSLWKAGCQCPFSHESPDRQSRQINVPQDRRVKALVLLAPALAWFRKRVP